MSTIFWKKVKILGILSTGPTKEFNTSRNRKKYNYNKILVVMMKRLNLSKVINNLEINNP